MALIEYARKRTFDKTPEPSGGQSPSSGPLRFVVQKHAASRLHYDFRLELDGVLKSWAVPKGPSLNPKDKRLAVMVEDHPFDYREFEGTIPAGNYGAGTVMVWDEGVYTSAGESDPGKAREALRYGLEKGHLDIVLAGQKLQGEFNLVKVHGRGENAWLLIKAKDEYASGEDITLEDVSAKSGQTMEAIAKGGGPVHRSNRAARKHGSSLPSSFKPMLTTLTDEPFDREGWLFEVKWDGYRIIAIVEEGRVRLQSRGIQDYTSIYPSIAWELKKVRGNAVLDGEVVVLDAKGRPDFGALQRYQETGEGDLVYMVFDCLYADGKAIMDLPLRDRRKILKPMLSGLSRVVLSEAVESEGRAFFEAIKGQGLEGMVAKDGESPYLQGRRGSSWLKVKTHARQEAVIGGFTEGRGSRKHFGALVLGVFKEDNLVYIGHTGGGFDESTLALVAGALKPLVCPDSPFSSPVKTNAPVQWVRPELVCEVQFHGWTDDGHMRHPVFVGLRKDKDPRLVVKELPRRVPAQNASAPSESRKAFPGLITHPDKIFWPGEGFTKGDVAAYYESVADLILPHLKDRPESLNRTPSGIGKPGFFEKNLENPPDWATILPIHSEHGNRDIHYLLCNDLRTLLYMVNLGCIELNPWHSRRDHLDFPDYALLDLDAKSSNFKTIVRVALQAKTLLDELGILSVPKTSGKTGIHVCIPLGGRYDYDQTKKFCEVIMHLIHQNLPENTSVLRDPKKRAGAVYLDFLQNRRGQTMAAPYCLRPVPGAPVSTPLQWKEINEDLDPLAFNIRTAAARFKNVGDLWAPVLGPGTDMEQALSRISEMVRA